MRSRGIGHDGVLRLIDQAYAAAEAPQLWETFLLSLAESVNGRGAALLRHDLMAAGAISVGVRLDPAGAVQYDRHFNRLDPWATPARTLGPGVVASDEMLIPSGALRRTEYFNDFADHYDATRLLTVVLEQQPGTNTVLSVLRGERDAPFDPADRLVVAAVVPHVQRALQIHQRMCVARHERAVAAEALDAVPCAVFLVTADATIVLTNSRGHAMLKANNGLSSERARLSAASPRETAKLRDLCALVARSPSGLGRHSGGAMAVTRRPSEGPPLHVLVAPAAPAERSIEHDRDVATIVFISDPAEDRAPSENMLQQAYGLTPAEAHVAARIAVGRSLAQIAAERGSALETVRRQNKQILAKTGARHRGELVSRLSIGMPMVTREDDR